MNYSSEINILNFKISFMWKRAHIYLYFHDNSSMLNFKTFTNEIF